MTPLVRKLGITDGSLVWVHAAPLPYRELLDYASISYIEEKSPKKTIDVAHLFVTERAVLAKKLRTLRSKLGDETALWVSWPKKASKLATDITENVIRSEALPLGFVDIKVCAVNEVWSGLKLVVRKELRTKKKDLTAH